MREFLPKFQRDKIITAGNNLTPITGNETLWGGAGKLTQAEVDYINSSPLLVAELNDYQAAINNGTAQPIGEISGSGNRLQTVTLSPGVQQIQMEPNVIGESATSFVGDLSYELGHFENYSNDQNLYNSLVPNPNDPTAGQMSGVVGTITEAESEANNYVVQQQISKNAGVTIKLNGDANSNGALQSALDNAFSADKANGISPEQDLSKFEEVASGIAGTIPVDNTGVRLWRTGSCAQKRVVASSSCSSNAERHLANNLCQHCQRLLRGAGESCGTRCRP